MIKELLIKIKNFLFPKKNKFLTSYLENETEKNEKTEKIKFEEYDKIDYDIEKKVKDLRENKNLDSLSIEELKEYISYFKSKSKYYSEKSNFISEKMDELIENNI